MPNVNVTINQVSQFQASSSVFKMEWNVTKVGGKIISYHCVTPRGSYTIRRHGNVMAAFYTGAGVGEERLSVRGSLVSLKKACREHYNKEAM